jgi:hypothetical protein
MAYTQGQKITLSNVALYVSSDAKKKSGTKTGTYYIWSAAVINNRIRITNTSANCGKTPAGKYVTGWIDTSSIPTTSSTKTTTTTTTTTKKTTTSDKVTVENVAASDVTPTTTVSGQIGYLGKVVFVVTEKQIKTIENFVWTNTATYVSHERHLGRPMVEFTGAQAGVITFNFTLSAFLGAAPMADYETLLNYQRNGTAIPLKIGKKAYGHYRWVITSLSYTGEYTDKNGNWIQGVVQVQLKEYEA